MTNAQVGGAFIAIVITIGLLFALREFWTWYFKINQVRDLLKQLVEYERQKAIKQKADENPLLKKDGG